MGDGFTLAPSPAKQIRRRTVEEDGEIVVEVELVDFDFPLDTARVVVVDLHRKVTTLVELAERRVWWVCPWRHGLLFPLHFLPTSRTPSPDGRL